VRRKTRPFAQRTDSSRLSKALLRKIRQYKAKKLFYTRIIQCSEGRDIKLTEDRLGQVWSAHLKSVFEILDEYPDMGYVHRTMEKLGEVRTWIKGIPLYERMAIHDACNVTLPYVRAVEKLLNIEPPLRASYLRVLLCEINRIAAFLYGFGRHIHDFIFLLTSSFFTFRS